MEDENEDVLPVYNVKVGDANAKAIDIIALRQWILIKEGEASILNIDSTKTADMRVSELQARVLQQNWMELKGMLDDVLGINQNSDEPEEQPEPPMTAPLPEIPAPLEAVPNAAPKARQPVPSHAAVMQDIKKPETKATPAPDAEFIQDQNDDQMIEL